MKKRTLVLLLIISLLCSIVPNNLIHFVRAQGETLWYGPTFYGGTIDSVRGDLTPSGLNNPDERSAKYFRHDLRFKNVINGQFLPTTSYFEAGGIELLPKPNEVITESGYLLIPLEESVIRNVVQKLEGNPDYVWNNSKNFSKYWVDGSPYVLFWDVVFYSGGGPAVKDGMYVGDGINQPLHKSTYLYSPKPEIKSVEFSASTVKKSEIKNHKLSVVTVTYSANYEGGNITRFYITGPNLDNVQLGISNPTAQKEGSYTYRVKKDFPLDFLVGLPSGTYTIRVETSDPFARTATPKTAQITIVDDDVTPTDPDPDPEPEPDPEPVLIPPIASLSATSVVMVGNDANIKLTGTAFDGATIEHYAIEVPGSMTGNIDSYSNTSFKGDYITWYRTAGDYAVYGKVWDSNGSESEMVYRNIKVIPPEVAPIISVTGSLKENRKFTITDNSIGPLRFPVDHTQTIWQIEAISGGSNQDIKYEGELKGKSKDVLIKKAGQYKVTLTAYINVFGEVISGTTSQIVNIDPDLPPVIDFEVTTPQLRDPSLNNVVILKIKDKSYSPDGDNLNLTYKYAYDSNNNGSFTDQTWVTVPSSSIKNGIIEINVGNNVGKYMIGAEAVESFGQPTLIQFVTSADYKKGNSLNKPIAEKIIEVQNLAPVTDITEAELTGKTKKIDIVINIVGTSSVITNAKNRINSYLIPSFVTEAIDYKITILENDKREADSIINSLTWRDNAIKYYIDYNSNLDYLDKEKILSTSLSLSSNNIKFIGVNSVNYKESIASAIALNDGYGKYIQFTNVSTVFTQVKEYVVNRKPVDIYINIRNTQHDDIKLLKKKTEDTIRPLLESYNLEPKITVIDGERIPENRLFYKGSDNHLYYYDPLNEVTTKIADNINSFYVADDGYLYYTIDWDDNFVNLYSTNLISNENKFIMRLHIRPYAGWHSYPNKMKDFIVTDGKLYAGIFLSLGYGYILDLVSYDLNTGEVKTERDNLTADIYNLKLSENGRIYYVTYRQDSEYSYTPILSEGGIAYPGNYYVNKKGEIYYFWNYLTTYIYSTNNSHLANVQANGSKIFGYNDKVFFGSRGVPAMNGIGGFYVYNETTKVLTPIISGRDDIALQAMTPDKIIWYTQNDEGITSIWKYNPSTGERIKSSLSLSNISNFAVYHHNAETRRTKKLNIEETLNKQYWRADASSYYVYLDDGSNTELTNTTTRNRILSKLNEEYTQFIGLGTSTNKADIEKITKELDYSTFIDNSDINKALTDLAIHIINTAGLKKRSIDRYVLINEEIEFVTSYEDKESDPIYDEKWKLTHDQSVFDNPLGIYEYSGQYIKNPPSYFSKTGSYEIIYNAKDNPKNNNAFDSYRLWSEDPATKFTLYAHRRPVADFEPLALYNGTSNRYELTIYDSSYDLDHSSRPDKGIVQRRWSYRTASDLTWKVGQPTQVNILEDYFIRLEVRDLEGVWSYPVVKQVIFTDNLPPTVDITMPSSTNINSPTIVTTSKPTIRWTYSDPNNDPQAIYQVRIYDQNNVLVKDYQTNSSTAQWVSDYALIKNQVYAVEVRANDGRLWSAWSTKKYMKYFVNGAPTVTITTIPSVIYEGDNVTVNVTAIDPDNDVLNLVVESRGTNGTWTVIWTKNSVLSGSTQSFSLSSVKLGSYELSATATDPSGASGSTVHRFDVIDLNVLGEVHHTEDWNSHRIRYNKSETGTENDPRTYDMFWRGEKLIVRARTTDTESNTKAQYVYAQIPVDYYEEFERIEFPEYLETWLTYNPKLNIWEGELTDSLDALQMIKNGSYDVTFMAIYTNGHREYDTVTIQFLYPWTHYFRLHRSR